MNLEKYAAPLTITAAFIAIYAFSRTLRAQPAFVAGSAPQPLTIPTAASIPLATYNVATPTPPPVQQGTAYTPFNPPNGVTYNKGFGVNLPPDPELNGCNTCTKTTSKSSSTGPAYQWNWGDAVYMNSAIL
jgi:hypothetical protein